MNSLMDLFVTVIIITTIATIAWIIDGYLMGEGK